MIELLADAATTSPESIPVWAQIAGGVGTFSFTAWFAYYTTKYTIPRLQKQHADALAKQTEIHSQTVQKYADTIDRIVSEFRQESKEQREENQRLLSQSNDLVRTSTEAVGLVTRAVERLAEHVHDLSRGQKNGAPLAEMKARAR